MVTLKQKLISYLPTVKFCLVMIAVNQIWRFHHFISSSRVASLLKTDSNPLIQGNKSFAKDIFEIAKDLESSTFRYYVYDHPDLVQQEVRTRVKSGKGSTWKRRWGRRFMEYAYGDLLQIEALEKHPMRTYDEAEADFVVIPIPVAGIVMYGYPSDTHRALEALSQEELFKLHPQKHVIICSIEFMFGEKSWKEGAGASGWTVDNYRMLSNVTVVKDKDLFLWNHAVETGLVDAGGWGRKKAMPLTKHLWSIGYASEAANPMYPYKPATFESFKNKTYHFFYHTRNEKFMNNSTLFRHAPHAVNASLTQPSSIGFDISNADWRTRFTDSKFCLVMRGDNPVSRAMYRSIRAGCIPVVISDMWEYYQPVFRSFLTLDTFAVQVPEQSFLANPSETLNNATKIPETLLRRKIEALNIVQRLLMQDHVNSLFVPAFSQETLASQSEDYYRFPIKVY